MLISFLITHFITDFLLQSREMGKKKSVELKWLVRHVVINFLGFALLTIFFNDQRIVLFALVNSLIHGVIDWYIWKGYKLTAHLRIKKMSGQYETLVSNWKYWEDHLFYTTIGLDQLLHTLTIVVLMEVMW